MKRYLSCAVFIALPCFLALLIYDWVAVVAAARGLYRSVRWSDFAQGALQDAGLASIYGLMVTPRVTGSVAGDGERARRLCLMMLGFGLAWYDVMCAWVTRWLNASQDLGVSLVMLFLVPFLVAPWYVRWLRSKVHAS